MRFTTGKLSLLSLQRVRHTLLLIRSLAASSLSSYYIEELRKFPDFPDDDDDDDGGPGIRPTAGSRGIPCSTVRRWDPSRRVASMGQREVQIQADGARAEPIQWKSCLIPLMAWVRTRLFPLRDASCCCFVLAD
jgi:hypothetical protein